MKHLLIMLSFMITKSWALSVATPSCSPYQLYYTAPGDYTFRCVNQCPVGTYVSFQTGRGTCITRFSPPNPGMNDCVQCQQNYYWQLQQQQLLAQQSQFNPWWNMNQGPWWAMQGSYYYPNFNYPGIWNNRGINGDHYPGNEHAHMMKPNIYVKNKSGKLTPFEFKFSNPKTEFLSTTPALKNFSWSGLVTKDKFRVENVGYDYLFYDFRGDHKKLQMNHGACVEKTELLPLMTQDLERFKFSKEAVSDFKEHWNVKIPDFPYYCIYPQYTDVVNSIAPIKITPSNSQVVRVIYIVVPYKDTPEKLANSFPKLPSRGIASLKSPEEQNSGLVFMEWGVGFLDTKLVP
jgi:hypothetical protein